MFIVPTALTSKSSNGRDAARSADSAAAAVWTIRSGRRLSEEPKDVVAAADIHLVVGECGERVAKPPLVPTGVSVRAERVCPLVVVGSVDLPAVAGEVCDDFRTDEPR